MSEREALFEPVRQLFALVWNQGRLELIDLLVTASVVLHAGRSAVHGRDNLKTIIADFLIGFPDVQHNIEDLVIEGDRVVTRWRGLGHHRGVYAGIAPTGREIDYSGITIFRIADGRIDEAWVNAEMPELLASLREA
jgi:predicted ester cyclase